MLVCQQCTYYVIVAQLYIAVKSFIITAYVASYIVAQIVEGYAPCIIYASSYISTDWLIMAISYPGLHTYTCDQTLGYQAQAKN